MVGTYPSNIWTLGTGFISKTKTTEVYIYIYRTEYDLAAEGKSGALSDIIPNSTTPILPKQKGTVSKSHMTPIQALSILPNLPVF